MNRKLSTKKNRKLKYKRKRPINVVSGSINSENRHVDWGSYPTTVLNFRGLMLPDRFKTTLLYIHNFRFMNAAATGTQIYRGNSCYDPDQTGAGGQPMGFDQFSIFYNKYRVTKSTLEISVSRSSESVRLCVVPSNSFTTPNTVDTAIQNPYNVLFDVSSTISNFNKKITMPTYRIWGVHPQSVLTQDNFAATVSTDPADPWAWILLGASYDGVTTATVWLDIRIYFEVEFFDRYPVAVSLEDRYTSITKSKQVRLLTKS